MNLELHDVVGTTGTAMVVISYLLLQLERISSDDLSYSLLNAIGAGLLLYSLVIDFNLAAVLIEVFWVLISMIGIWKYVAARRRTTGKV